MAAIEHQRVEVGEQSFSPTYLQGVSQRLRESGNPELSTAIPIGLSATRQPYPILIPAEHWQSHMLIMGATRTGKTAKGVIPLLLERIRQRAWPAKFAERHGGQNPLHGPVVVGDLKGDDVMFHATRLEAIRQGRKFLYYTNVRKFSTHLLNPLLQDSFGSLTTSQFVQIILNALNLWHGVDYGRGYYSSINRTTLSQAMEAIEARGELSQLTFSALRTEIRSIIRRNKELSDALELLTVIEDLAQILQLNFTTADSHRLTPEALNATIHFPDILTPDENGQYPVVYFYLRVGEELSGAAQVMKLAIYALKTARQHIEDLWKLGRKTQRPPVVPLFLDEWQCCADASIENFLQQAAGLGLHLVLSNQDPSQLRTSSGDLMPTVWENCGSKLFYSTREQKLQEMVMKASGEKTSHVAAWQVSHDDLRTGSVGPENAIRLMNDAWQAVNIQEQIVPRLSRNDLIEISNSSEQCVYIPAPATSVANYGGYAMRISTDYFHSRQEYDYLSRLPWPEPTPETIVPEDFIESDLSTDANVLRNPNQPGIAVTVPSDGDWL